MIKIDKALENYFKDRDVISVTFESTNNDFKDRAVFNDFYEALEYIIKLRKREDFKSYWMHTKSITLSDSLDHCVQLLFNGLHEVF